MNISKALKQGPPRKRGATCTIALILSTLDSVEGDALRAMLTDSRWGSVAIADLLTENGYPIANYTVNTHRRGGCACQRRGVL